jgi:glycosyltransferase involved in cell wall biosynthesis
MPRSTSSRPPSRRSSSRTRSIKNSNDTSSPLRDDSMSLPKQTSIGIYSHSIAPSIDGVCRRYSAILTEMRRIGYKVVLFTIEDEPEGIPPDIEYITLDHMIMPAYPGKKVARPGISMLFRIIAALSRNKVDVLHITNDGFSHIFALACWYLGITVVGCYHTDLLELLSKNGGNWFQKSCIYTKEFIDTYVLDSCATTSKSFENKLAGLHIPCQHIIVTAVDTDIFSKSKRNEKLRKEMMFGNEKGFLCVYVGRISREKRIDICVDVISQMKNVYLAIIGDGPSASYFASMHGKENRIYCKPGFLDHDTLAEIYASSDVHFSASEFETLGNTVLEAHACSVPVVVPRTQGFCDTVKHEKDGYLFEPGDAASARSYIEKLKGNKSLRQKMSMSALEAIKGNKIDRVVNDLFGWYKLGEDRKAQKSILSTLLGLFLMAGSIPTGIFALACYDLLVSNYSSSHCSRLSDHMQPILTL